MLEDCTHCGLCRNSCAVFDILKTETIAPRGLIHLAKNKQLTENLYKCTLCKNCKLSCPVNVDLTDDIRELRAKIIASGKSYGKEIINNIRRFGNPYGKK